MTRMIGSDPEQQPTLRLGAAAWYVRGERFANSAAKFWSSLVDEVRLDYPTCDRLTLATLSDVALDRSLLFPETALQRELDRAPDALDTRAAIRRALAEFELLGPPGAVQLTLSAGATELKRCDLPLDCLDADIFPCLLVWLLEWAALPTALWEHAAVFGTVDAHDRTRDAPYRLAFDLTNTHVSEGLFRRTVTVRFDAPAGAGAGPLNT